MKPFSSLWVGVPARMRYRLAFVAIPMVATEILEMSPEDRGAILAALDHPDAPDGLMKRAALIHAYITQYLGGVPEKRGLEAELAASIGLELAGADVAGGDGKAELVALTAVMPVTVATAVPRQAGKAPPSASSASEAPEASTPAVDAACEKRAAEIAAANAETPARKSERIVPLRAPVTPVDAVTKEARERLESARELVSTVAGLDALMRANRDFVTGKRFKDGDEIVIVNRRALTTRERAKACYRAESWTFVPVELAREALADWELFLQTLSGKEITLEARRQMLQERVDHEYGVINDSTSRGDDKCVAHFVIWLAKEQLAFLKRGAENGAARKESEAEDSARLAERVELEAKLRERFTTRSAIQKRQAEIKARHKEIAAALNRLSESPSCLDAKDKSGQIATLKVERDQLGQEFEIISNFWKEAVDDREDGQPSFRVVDSTRPGDGMSAFVFGRRRNEPTIRRPGKTAREQGAKNALSDKSTSVYDSPEERERRRQEAKEAEKRVREERVAKAKSAAERRDDPHFGESRKGHEPKKAKGGSGKGGDAKTDRRAAKRQVKRARG